jgi:hypothetical protein
MLIDRYCKQSVVVLLVIYLLNLHDAGCYLGNGDDVFSSDILYYPKCVQSIPAVR